jgi:hypothetical protein
MWTDPGNIQIADRHMNVEIVTESAKFPKKEYINGILIAVLIRHVLEGVIKLGLVIFTLLKYIIST